MVFTPKHPLLPLTGCAVQVRANIAASFQRVAVFHLAARVSRAIEWAREVEPSVATLVVAGGVASNQALRAALDTAAARGSATAVYPPVRLCTDNGAMRLLPTSIRPRGLRRPRGQRRPCPAELHGHGHKGT